mmetsp:Transcript_10449/g.21133  ORF Transcript_10449/g.21133 Transcript_10449/m.21133 type:complete len:163 (-) Transcript_10449:90-578(-)
MCRGGASGGWRPPREYSGKEPRVVPQTYSIDEPSKWICMHCMNSNFSKRDECQRCHKPKPFVSNLEAARTSTVGGTGLYAPPNIDPTKDWQCTCGNWNFARREECFKCSGRKGAARGPGGKSFDDEDTDRRKRRAEESRRETEERKAQKRKCDACKRFSCIC